MQINQQTCSSELPEEKGSEGDLEAGQQGNCWWENDCQGVLYTPVASHCDPVGKEGERKKEKLER